MQNHSRRCRQIITASGKGELLMSQSALSPQVAGSRHAHARTRRWECAGRPSEKTRARLCRCHTQRRHHSTLLAKKRGGALPKTKAVSLLGHVVQHPVEDLLAFSNAVCLFLLLRQQNASGVDLTSLWSKHEGGALDMEENKGYSAKGSEEEQSLVEAEEEERRFVSSRSIPTAEEVWEQVQNHVQGNNESNPSVGGGGQARPKGRVMSGKMPKLVLQCLKPSERSDLLQICLEVLKRRISELEIDEKMGSGSSGNGKVDEDFKRLCANVLNGCVKEAAEKWLGYQPETKEIIVPSASSSSLDVEEKDGRGRESWTVLNLLQDDKWFLYTSAFYSLAFGKTYLEQSKAKESKGWVSCSRTIATSCSHIVEDCVVMIAESVADAYLEEASQGVSRSRSTGTAETGRESGSGGGTLKNVASQPYPDTFDPVLIHPILNSTRKIERFRNQVGLYRLLYQYFLSVQFMYEDKYRLWSYSSAAGILVEKFIPLRRAEDLRKLKGVRRSYGLFLEASDVFLPIARRLFSFVQEGISLLLVLVIGRGLGLILKGIRESVKGTEAKFTRSDAKGDGSQKNREAEDDYSFNQEDLVFSF